MGRVGVQARVATDGTQLWWPSDGRAVFAQLRAVDASACGDVVRQSL